MTLNMRRRLKTGVFARSDSVIVGAAVLCEVTICGNEVNPMK